MCSHRPPLPRSLYRYWCLLKEAKQKYPNQPEQMATSCYLTVPITLIERAYRYFLNMESDQVMLQRLIEWSRYVAFMPIPQEDEEWEELVTVYESY